MYIRGASGGPQQRRGMNGLRATHSPFPEQLSLHFVGRHEAVQVQRSMLDNFGQQ